MTSSPWDRDVEDPRSGSLRLAEPPEDDSRRDPSEDALDSPDAVQRVIRGSVMRTVSYVLALLAGVGSLPFLFRHLGVEESGRYATALSVAAIVHGVVEGGLSSVSVRDYSLATRKARPALMRDMLGLRMAVVAAVSVSAVLIMVLAGYPKLLVIGAGIAMSGALFESVSSVYGVWLSTSLQLGRLATMQLVRQAVAVLLTIVLVVLGAPLLAFFAVLAVAAVCQLLTSLVATRGAVPHLPSLNVSAWWGLFRRSAPYIIAMAVGVIYVRVAIVSMPVLSSAEQTGYLGVPFRLLEIVTVVAALALSSAFPMLARAAQHDPARHRYALRRLLEVAALGGGWVALVALTGADTIVQVLAGPGFDGSVTVLRILAFSLAAQFLIAALSFALLSVEAYVDVLIANSVALVLAVVMTVVTVPSLGAIGGAISTAAADAALVAGYAVALRRALPGTGVSRRFAAAIGSAFAIAAGVALSAPIPDAMAIVVASTLYAGIVCALRAVPSELMAVLPGHRAQPSPVSAAPRPGAGAIAAPANGAVASRASIPVHPPDAKAPPLLSAYGPCLPAEPVTTTMITARRMASGPSLVGCSALRTAVQAEALRLVGRGMPRELASAIGEVAASTLLPLLPGADAADLVRDALMRRIPVAPLGRGAGVVGFVGPAGAGKTYCAARLAVAHARHGVFPVAVISLRPPDGGAELTRLLAPHRIPIHAVATGAEAAATVRDLRGHGLVIIDTPGVSPRSRVELRTLGMELGRIGPDELHLVVSATIGSGQGHELIDGLRELGVSALLITHTDETDHVGTLVGLAIETQIPVSYVARSQASDAGLRPATAAGLAALVGYGGTADGSSRTSRPVAR